MVATIVGMSSVRRLAPIGALALAALALSGCGGGSAAAVDLWLGTDAVVARNVTTPPQPAETGTETAASSTERSPHSQQYTVQRNDSVSGIARKCGVEMSALLGINEWTDATQVQLNPDQVIQVPPDGYIGCGGGSSSSSTDSSTDSGSTDSGSTDSGSGTSETGKCADGSDAETHTIVSGDNPTKVANANDITVAELQAANEGNSRVWNSFPIGAELYLPC